MRAWNSGRASAFQVDNKGSNPLARSKFSHPTIIQWLESNPDKIEVPGSIPGGRTKGRAHNGRATDCLSVFKGFDSPTSRKFRLFSIVVLLDPCKVETSVRF